MIFVSVLTLYPAHSQRILPRISQALSMQPQLRITPPSSTSLPRIRLLTSSLPRKNKKRMCLSAQTASFVIPYRLYQEEYLFRRHVLVPKSPENSIPHSILQPFQISQQGIQPSEPYMRIPSHLQGTPTKRHVLLHTKDILTHNKTSHLGTGVYFQIRIRLYISLSPDFLMPGDSFCDCGEPCTAR